MFKLVFVDQPFIKNFQLHEIEKHIYIKKAKKENAQYRAVRNWVKKYSIPTRKFWEKLVGKFVWVDEEYAVIAKVVPLSDEEVQSLWSTEEIPQRPTNPGNDCY